MARVTSSMFKEVVSFENPTKHPDGTGGRREMFNGFCITRGYFRKRSGFRALQDNSRDVLVQEYDFYCYWRKDLENGLTKDTHIVFDNKMYQILDYGRVDEQRQFYQFKLIQAQ